MSSVIEMLVVGNVDELSQNVSDPALAGEMVAMAASSPGHRAPSVEDAGWVLERLDHPEGPRYAAALLLGQHRGDLVAHFEATQDRLVLVDLTA